MRAVKVSFLPTVDFFESKTDLVFDVTYHRNGTFVKTFRLAKLINGSSSGWRILSLPVQNRKKDFDTLLQAKDWLEANAQNIGCDQISYSQT